MANTLQSLNIDLKKLVLINKTKLATNYKIVDDNSKFFGYYLKETRNDKDKKYLENWLDIDSNIIDIFYEKFGIYILSKELADNHIIRREINTLCKGKMFLSTSDIFLNPYENENEKQIIKMFDLFAVEEDFSLLWKDCEIETISPVLIFPGQQDLMFDFLVSKINSGYLESGLDTHNDDIALAFMIKEKVVLYDGHHRTALDILNQKEQIKIKII